MYVVEIMNLNNYFRGFFFYKYIKLYQRQNLTLYQNRYYLASGQERQIYLHPLMSATYSQKIPL